MFDDEGPDEGTPGRLDAAAVRELIEAVPPGQRPQAVREYRALGYPIPEEYA